jgi:hypothetical protein
MRLHRFGGLRRRLSYANVMATLAFFFALTGGTMAATKYLQASDPITQGDLAGSTYGNPVIAAGKVTTGKIADGAITSAKFASGATAPSASAIGALNITTASGSIESVLQGAGENGIGHFTVSCPPDRLAFNPQITATIGTFAQPPLMSHPLVNYHPDDPGSTTTDRDLQSYTFTVDFSGSFPNAATGTVSCFGSGS